MGHKACLGEPGEQPPPKNVQTKDAVFEMTQDAGQPRSQGPGSGLRGSRTHSGLASSVLCPSMSHLRLLRPVKRVYGYNTHTVRCPVSSGHPTNGLVNEFPNPAPLPVSHDWAKLSTLSHILKGQW